MSQVRALALEGRRQNRSVNARRANVPPVEYAQVLTCLPLGLSGILVWIHDRSSINWSTGWTKIWSSATAPRRHLLPSLLRTFLPGYTPRKVEFADAITVIAAKYTALAVRAS